MRSQTGRMALLAAKVSVAATLAMVLATLGAILPGVSAGLSPADEPAPDKVKADPTPKGEAAKPAPAKFGLLQNDSLAFQGYTLIAPMFSKTTYLIDMEGKVVRTWESDCTPGVSAYLLENGHLLRPGAQQPTPSGFGPGAGGRVQEFDGDGQLLWDFQYVSEKRLPHHDVARLPNGNVLLIVWEKKTKEDAIAAGRRPDLVGNAGIHPDYLIEVKPTGKTTGEIVWEWHLWDHLVQDHDRSKPNFGNVTDHPELVDLNFGAGEGPIAPMMATKDGVAKLQSLGYLGGTPAPVAKDAPKPQPEEKSRPEPKGNSKSAPKPKSGPNQGRPNTNADWTHFNAVAYNPDLDQLVVSVHAFSEFWIIDHSTTTAEAASHKGGRSGKGGDLLYRWGNPRAYRNGSKIDQRLFSQHNAHWISPGLPGEGHMLVFNNGSGRPGGDSSSVDEIVLPVDSQGQYTRDRRGPYGPIQAVWSYSAPKKSDFYSFFISGAQRLPNGNTLICSGASGTVFEVTPEKQVVWKYANPVMGNPGGPGGPGGPPGSVDLLPLFVRRPLDLSPDQTKQIDDFQKELGRKLEKTLTDAQWKQVRELNPSGPRGFAAFPLPGQIISKSTLTALHPSVDQQKQLDDLQNEVDAKLDKMLNDDQKKRLNEARENFGRGGTVGGGPPGGAGGPQQKGQGGPQQKGQGGGPPRGPGGPIAGNTLFRAYRYGPGFPGFAGKMLKPGKTIEEMETLKKAKDVKSQETAKK